jgi:polysaccharide export outer membrane protein
MFQDWSGALQRGWPNRRLFGSKRPRISRFNWAGVSGAAFLLCSGCAEAPAPASGVVQAISPVVSMQSQTLPPKDIPQAANFHADDAYRLGPNDVISVSVYNHPELSAPPPGNTTTNGGILVTSDGSINLPLIGRLQVGGMTLSDLQDQLNQTYNQTLKDANVTVQLVAAESLRYYLLGAFTSPGVKFPGHAMSLLDALALGGSVQINEADLDQAYVADGPVKIAVDMRALLINGDLSQNIMLEPGDAIIIPPSTAEDAFVFGSVGKPGAVPFLSGRLSLLQALSQADLDLPNYTAARLHDVHLIRSQGASGQYYVIDAAKILSGEATNFDLRPGDIVFVPPTEVASWNQVLTMLLPSLNTVSGVLNPFVSIKYLSSGRN